MSEERRCEPRTITLADWSERFLEPRIRAEEARQAGRDPEGLEELYASILSKPTKLEFVGHGLEATAPKLTIEEISEQAVRLWGAMQAPSAEQMAQQRAYQTMSDILIARGALSEQAVQTACPPGFEPGGEKVGDWSKMDEERAPDRLKLDWFMGVPVPTPPEEPPAEPVKRKLTLGEQWIVERFGRNGLPKL